MLFSDETIADFINENFESSWQSVRPVPTVTIDFGNSTKVTRTLHGNIATYICRADATVLDVLPGVYDPDSYLEKLKELRLLSEYLVQQEDLLDPDSRLYQYHKVRASAIDSGKPFTIKKTEVSRSTILGVEKSIKIVLNPLERLATRGAMGQMLEQSRGQTSNGMTNLKVNEAEDTETATTIDRDANEQAGNDNAPETLNDRLAIDSRINEELRRLQIHKYILTKGLTTPDDMHKWLYREVLHADLDDPYMGLGKVLFENYPFAEEDARNSN